MMKHIYFLFFSILLSLTSFSCWSQSVSNSPQFHLFAQPEYNQQWQTAYLYLKNNQFFSPEKNNAIETYLQLRETCQKNNDLSCVQITQNALNDLYPYLDNLIEQKILDDKNSSETKRLFNLLYSINPKAPSSIRLLSLMNSPQ